MKKTSRHLAVVLSVLSVGAAGSELGQTWKANPFSATWNTSDANWTPNETWQGGAAVFGESSQKNVNVSGTVSATGLSFTTDGYTVGGEGALLFPETTEIAVADGVTATLAAAATGTVQKTGGGTLVLTGRTSLGRVVTAGGTLRLAGGLHSVTGFSRPGNANVTLEADGGMLQTVGGGFPLANGSFAHVKVGTGGLHLLISNGTGYGAVFESGVADGVDGGVHFYGKELANWWPARATSYTGGTYWENSEFGTSPWVVIGGTVDTLGAIPAEPTDNLFINASHGRIHLGDNIVLHRNRDIVIGTNNTLSISVGSGHTARICGRIHGSDGHDTTTRLFTRESYAANGKGTEWRGTLALAPGANRTNRIGRLTVDLPVLIESGVTLLTGTGYGIGYGAYDSTIPLNVEAHTADYSETKGVLTVTGGVLRVAESRHVVLREHAQVRVTGGSLEMSGSEYLNGLSGHSRTTVSGTGRLDLNVLRLSQSPGLGEDGLPLTSVNVCTGGVLRLRNFYIDIGKNDTMNLDGSLNLDGGTVMPISNHDSFLGTGAKTWNRILVRVCAGGAIFDTDGFNVTVKNPLLSGTTADGGLVKRGLGTLTLASTNLYNGVTRVEAGLLAFTHKQGCPGGGFAFSAATLAAQPVGTPLVTVAGAVTFREGCGLCIEDADRLDLTTFGKPRTLVTAGEPFTSVPPVTFVASDGTMCGTGNGWGGWNVMRSSDGCSLLLSGNPGTVVILR